MTHNGKSKPAQNGNSRPVIEVKRPDTWNVCPKITMNSRAFDAQYYTKIDTGPVRIWNHTQPFNYHNTTHKINKFLLFPKNWWHEHREQASDHDISNCWKKFQTFREYGMLYLLGALQSAHTEFPDTERIVAVTATADALFVTPCKNYKPCVNKH